MDVLLKDLAEQREDSGQGEGRRRGVALQIAKQKNEEGENVKS